MRVFLTGATGFVGSHLLARLLRDGHSVRALVRRPEMLPASYSTRVEAVRGDLGSAELPKLVAGCEAVINLVGIIYERGSETFEAVHHLGTKNLVNAVRQNGVSRFVQMSALGARPLNASLYHTTKFAAEEEVRNSGVPFAILRPSLIVGPGSAFIRQMVDVIRAVPLIRPVPGSGMYRFRPVHVNNVVECFTQALTNPRAASRTIDLVGGEELSLNEIAKAIADCLGTHKTAMHIPIPLMKMAAAVFSVLPVQPPVTAVQIRMLQEGSTADPATMKSVFGIEPAGFRATLAEYLNC